MRYKNCKRIASIVLSLIMVVLLLPVQAAAATSQTFAYDGYSVTYTVNSSWTGNQSVGVKLTNTGREDIYGWALQFDATGSIKSIWDAVIYSENGTGYILKNAQYNGKIKPGQSASFGYMLAGNNLAVPQGFTLCTKWVEKKDGYDLTVSRVSDWGTSFHADISLKNTSGQTLEFWRLAFDANVKINSGWNANFMGENNGKYSFESAENTSYIKSGETRTFTVAGTKAAGTTVNLSGFVLSEPVVETGSDLQILLMAQYAPENGLQLSWYTDAPDGIFDILQSDDNSKYSVYQTVQDVGSFSMNAPDFNTKYFKVKQTDPDGRVAVSNFILVNKSDNGYAVELPDSDGDGVSDAVENMLGTDPKKPDTDGDGLTDYEELCLTETDPLIWDSVQTGTSDGLADSDKDGLTNLEEVRLGADPHKPDSDGDRLTDGDEVHKYFTNPLKYDTDADKMGDDVEIRYGTDPNNPDTNGNGILDGDESYSVTLSYGEEGAPVRPNVTVQLDGSQIETLAIDKVDSEDTFLNTDIPGYVYNAFDFHVDGSFDSARLSFELDPELFNDPAFVPAVYYWDEDAQFLFELPNQQINGRTLTADNIPNGSAGRTDIRPFVEKQGNPAPDGQNDWMDILANPNDQHVDNPSDTGATNDAESDASQPEAGESSGTTTPGGEEVIPEPENSNGDGQSDENPTLDVELTHFSKYIVLAKNIHDQELYRYTILPPADGEMQNKKFDVALLLDESGSISSSNYSLMKTMTVGLINKLADDDRIAVFTFDNIIRKRTTFVSKSSAAATVSSLTQSGGNTAIYSAIDAANKEFIGNSSSDATKVMILLTDGQNNSGITTADGVTRTAMDNGIVIYTVGIGSVNTAVLNAIAAATGGQYYPGSSFSQLEGIFDRLIADADLYKDSDNDKISDYHEKKISLGQLLLGTGAPLTSFLSMNYLTSDSDNDGILDGNEMKIQSQQIADKSVYYTYMYSNPCSSDSDGDGLLDGSPVYVNGRKVAPKDPDPLVVNGPQGVWKAQIKQEKNGTIPRQYSDDETLLPDIKPPVSKAIADGLVKFALSHRDLLLEHQDVVRWLALKVKGICEGNAAAGAYILNFKYDEYEIAYHSQVDTWQRAFGYNEMYDDVFKIGSYMLPIQFPFSYNNQQYVLWGWKGDYWNLQSGSEIGLYVYNGTFSGTKHYDAVGFELPMTLNLYNYYSKNNIENVFNWAPVQKQWWITGFNTRFREPNPDVMVTLGSVDFAGREAMFNELKKAVSNNGLNASKDLIFDEDGHTVWVVWGGK